MKNKKKLGLLKDNELWYPDDVIDVEVISDNSTNTQTSQINKEQPNIVEAEQVFDTKFDYTFLKIIAALLFL